MILSVRQRARAIVVVDGEVEVVCDQTPTLTSDSVGKCRLAGVEKGVIALRLDGLLDGTSATI